MTGRIALVGGDEFLPKSREMDNQLLEATGHIRPNVLIVPTAAAAERPALAAQHGVQQFEALGANATPLMVVNSEDADNPSMISSIAGADILYLTGGNPAHLLDVLRGSLLLRRISQELERGLILAGSSAGAMVLGERMRFRQWGDALGIIPRTAVLPHHEHSSRNQTMLEIAVYTSDGLTVLGIDGATGCFRDGDKWRVLGTGSVTVYREGDWERFESGEYFEINGK